MGSFKLTISFDPPPMKKKVIYCAEERERAVKKRFNETNFN